MSAVNNILRFLSLPFVSALMLMAAMVSADEIVIDSKVDSTVTVGDFDCSKCPTATDLMQFEDGNRIKAGELWKFLAAQQIQSTESLTICLDIQPTVDIEKHDFKGMQLLIQDPANANNLLTNVSIGENSLVVPGYEVTAFKPEAKLEINLGYDFMERFSADSQEYITIRYYSDDKTADASVVSIGSNDSLSSKLSIKWIIGFTLFWTVIFFSLNRFTKPRTAPLTPVRRQVASA